MTPLDPAQLTPAASLNRARIVDLPGIALEDPIRGKAAYDLLAARILAEDVRGHAGILGLDALSAAPDTHLLPAFALCLAADNPHVQAAADAIARRFGRSLGALILTLKRGDPINRRARPDWDNTYWDYWAGIETIWLGGGLANGPLGARIHHHAAAMLAEDQSHACAIHLAAYPSLLPLIGAARCVPPTRVAALVFDFGQSAVKRALARYNGGELASLHLLPSLAAPEPFVPDGTNPTPAQVHDLADCMATILVKTWRDAAEPVGTLAPLLVASIASYVRDGQPLPRQGGLYAYLHGLSSNAAHYLALRVSRQLGRSLDIALIHDGTAAAQAQTATTATAVIVMGTALGVGFVPAPGILCPLAHGFGVQDAQGAFVE